MSDTVDLIDWSKCTCQPENYPEEQQTNPDCPEHEEAEAAE